MSEFSCGKLVGVIGGVILRIAYILWYVDLYYDVAVTSKGDLVIVLCSFFMLMCVIAWLTVVARYSAAVLMCV